MNVLDYNLTKGNILKNVSEKEIMEFYLGYELNKQVTIIKSPYYIRGLQEDEEEKNASLNITIDSNGKVLWYDFGYDIGGDAFELVKFKFSFTNFNQVLEKINKDFKIGLINDYSGSDNTDTIIQYKKDKSSSLERTKIFLDESPWRLHHLDYWYQFGITKKVLESFNVVPCNRVYVGFKYYITSSKNFPIFAYKYSSGRVRIYMPYAEKGKKFLGTATIEDIQGWDQLQKSGGFNLVITKSQKDVMLINSLNLNSFAPASENAAINLGVIRPVVFKYINKFILFDNDDAGKAGASRLSSALGIRAHFIDENLGVKDISEFYFKFGRRRTIEFLHEHLMPNR